MKKAFLLWCMVIAATLLGCDSDSTAVDSSDVVDSSGPLVKSGTAWEVWSVENAWLDKDTKNAKLAGIAWPENSGLTWEEKYDRWVGSLETMPNASGSGTTITVTTPFGDKKLPGPTLECAEVAMALRVAFASWYHLPFFIRGWDSANKRTMYAGHFGFVDSSGNAIAGFPQFTAQYKNYEKTWKVGDAWPHDEKLRQKHLGDNDGNDFLTDANGQVLGAGAYFDEIFLNKRTGHFMRLMLLYYGSVNLADGSNMFHIKPEATSPGDVLLERWQKEGIGHTIPVFRVDSPIEGKLAISVATGSMPRRQPKWEDALESRRYFTMDATGGEGTTWGGEAYASLGGGIRRWRTATNKSGRWSNDVSAADKAVAIDNSDLAAIAARPGQFDKLLITGSPEETKAALLNVIHGAREHLLAHPASCSARETREKAFEDLYAIADKLGTTPAAIDAELRVRDDHVFAPLVYNESKTCCWNSTTPQMAEIILDFARTEKEAADAEGVCRAPTVFRSQADGYAVWKDHAAKMGRAADWLEWSEDEPCEQRAVAQDKLDMFEATPLCSTP